jgi:hypothetical protein
MNTTCLVNDDYNGASDIGTCALKGDKDCASPGPDMVAGAVLKTADRLDLLDFSANYLTARQITVKRGFMLGNIELTKTFQCFDETLWFIGLFIEIAIAFFLIFTIEAMMFQSNQIDRSSPLRATYDSFYFAFGSALNCGEPAHQNFPVSFVSVILVGKL